MKTIDDLILSASHDVLKKIQDLDLQTQLDGKSFYDNCIESKIPSILKTIHKSK